MFHADEVGLGCDICDIASLHCTMDWRPCTPGPFASRKGTLNSRRRSTNSSCSLSAPARKLERNRIQKMSMTVNQSLTLMLYGWRLCPGRMAILKIPILLWRWKSPNVRLGAARALSPIFSPRGQRKGGPNQCSVDTCLYSRPSWKTGERREGNTHTHG